LVGGRRGIGSTCRTTKSDACPISADLKTPRTGPHGLCEDKDGNIWFTGNSAALIGKLDPKTGAVTEYPMPAPDANDPHTLIFDRDGILWFTVQQANMVGRLDPATGDIQLVTSPTPKSRPYGMALNSKNVVFFVDFGTNKVASIDAKTMQITAHGRDASPSARMI
jgi:virginiamycin B lyase